MRPEKSFSIPPLISHPLPVYTPDTIYDVATLQVSGVSEIISYIKRKKSTSLFVMRRVLTSGSFWVINIMTIMIIIVINVRGL
jgi:hypothetical protein